jgi:hypothetical protein
MQDYCITSWRTHHAHCCLELPVYGNLETCMQDYCITSWRTHHAHCCLELPVYGNLETCMQDYCITSWRTHHGVSLLAESCPEAVLPVSAGITRHAGLLLQSFSIPPCYPTAALLLFRGFLGGTCIQVGKAVAFTMQQDAASGTPLTSGHVGRF